MPVYFMRAKTCDGPIKIGYSENPKKRLSQIQGMSPNPLEILTTVDGDEAAIQQYFNAERLHGEWFTATERLLNFIKSPFDIQHTNHPNAHIVRAQGHKFFQAIHAILMSDNLSNCPLCGIEILIITRKKDGEEFEFEFLDDGYCSPCADAMLKESEFIL
jgi:hypothetical protein